MPNVRVIAAIALVLSLAPGALRARPAITGESSGVDAFNTALAHATRRMDNAATLALWSDDGVSILPGAKPLRGKAAICAFMSSVTASLPSAHMERFDLQCHDIAISGDWASEWCTEHQVVRFADGRAPFDGRGNLAFVLHRANDGRWRIRTEMWNQGVADEAGKSH